MTLKAIKPVTTTTVNLSTQPSKPSMPHFIADHQLTKKDVLALIDLAKDIKYSDSKYSHVLAGKSVAMIFEKPSLRTMVSFDIGINKLGGHALNLGQQNGKLGERERVKDYAKNLSCFADAIVARVFDHNSILELAEYGSVPVINALCDQYHPCQALADFITMSEYYDDLSTVKLAYVGDSNNVSNSLMTLAAILGVNFTLVCPKGHEPSADILEQTQFLYDETNNEDANATPAGFVVTHEMSELGEQDVIYTDTWISMGDSAESNEEEGAQLISKFMPFQIDHNVMQKTGATKLMHCQPAHLEHEITTELFDDASKSIVFQQAENRMWAQCAVLVSLMD